MINSANGQGRRVAGRRPTATNERRRRLRSPRRAHTRPVPLIAATYLAAGARVKSAPHVAQRHHGGFEARTRG